MHGTCTRRAVWAKYCKPHARMLKRRGMIGFVATGPMIAHLQALQGLGWTQKAIAEAAGIAYHTVHHLLKNEPARCLRETLQAVMSVPLVESNTLRHCDPTGARRRVRSLQYMGWTYTDIARESGLTYAAVIALFGKRHDTSWATHVGVKEVFERLHMTRGPSSVIAARARNLGAKGGFFPPMAWDDHTIDDPNAEPNLGERSSTRGVPFEEIEFLRSYNKSDAQVARELGISMYSIREKTREAA